MGVVRFFLALSVVLEHVGLGGEFYSVSGRVAVYFFFVISGFYMTLVLDTKYPPTAEGTKNFYIARYLRLYPAYIVTFLIVILFYRPIGNISNFAPFTQLYVYFVSFTMIGYDTLQWFSADAASKTVSLASTTKLGPGTPITLDMLPYMRQMWSIGIEIWFYLIAPFVLRGSRAIFITAVIAIAIYITICLNFDYYAPIRSRSLFGNLYMFLYGAIGYLFYKHFLGANLSKYVQSRQAIIVFSLITLCIVTFYIMFQLPIFHRLTTIVGSTYLAIDIQVVGFALIVPFLFHITKSWDLDRSIGELSYPLYVVHWPIALVVLKQFKDQALWPMTSVTLSIVCAIALHVFVERQTERARSHFTQKALKRTIASATQKDRC